MLLANLSILCLCITTGLGFDEMFIEGSHASYKENLKAATKINSGDFDEAFKILQFPLFDIEFDGIIGKAQYDVAMFRGIKYATAERFGEPSPLKIPKSGGKIIATKAGPSCPQPSQEFFDHPGKYTEDCLYLDVYVPIRKTIVATPHYNYDDAGQYLNTDWIKRKRHSPYSNLPIVIAFQGEDFTYLESKTVDGRTLAKYGSVMVVVVNYRTGILGFLSSGNEDIKGNFGLADQKMAISWVKENAKRFGGDPSTITLLGYSSGAESVAMQMFDPTNSKHLFGRVILQSGVTRQGGLFANNKTAEMAIQQHLLGRIAEYIGCSEDVVECLRSANVTDLIAASGTLAFERGENRTFGPIAEDKHSCDLVDLSQYEVMIGSVEFEAGNIASSISENQPLNKSIEDMLSYFESLRNPPSNLLNYLQFEYSSFPDVNTDNKNLYGFVKAATDFQYIVPGLSFASRISSLGAKTYVYRFSPKVVTLQPGKPYFIEDRVVHGEDQKYIFGLPLVLLQLFTATDRNISANYIRMITNFAHSGDPDIGPTGKPSEVPSWIPYDSINMGTYEISEVFEMKYKLFAKTLSIWNEAVPHLIENEICKTAEEPAKIEKVGGPDDCAPKGRRSKWEDTYKEWKRVQLPEWRENFEKMKQGISGGDSCLQ